MIQCEELKTKISDIQAYLKREDLELPDDELACTIFATKQLKMFCPGRPIN